MSRPIDFATVERISIIRAAEAALMRLWVLTTHCCGGVAALAAGEGGVSVLSCGGGSSATALLAGGVSCSCSEVAAETLCGN